MALEHTPELGAFVYFNDHDDSTAEQMDFEMTNTGIGETADHFRPDVLVVMTIGGDRGGIVPEIEREYMPVGSTDH